MGVIDFKTNFEMAIQDILIKNNIVSNNKIKFIITANEEEKKKIKSIDYLYMPYGIYENKLLSKEEVLDILTGGLPSTFPLWINMSFYSIELGIIKLECSYRFRKSVDLLNKDYGYPPFKVE